MRSLRNTLRQWAFPREFRIPDAGEPQALTLDDLRALLRAKIPPAERADSEELSAQDRQFFIELATTAWRLGRQTAGDAESRRDKLVRRRVEMLHDTLGEYGVVIRDFSGAPPIEGEIWDEVVGGAEEKRHPVIESMQVPRIEFRGHVLVRGIPIIVDAAGEMPNEGSRK